MIQTRVGPKFMPYESEAPDSGRSDRGWRTQSKQGAVSNPFPLAAFAAEAPSRKTSPLRRLRLAIPAEFGVPETVAPELFDKRPSRFTLYGAKIIPFG